MSDEQAKAVQEVAKTTTEIVKAAGGVGSYVARVLGSVPENLLGLIVGDWLEHKRRRHLRLLELNTARLLETIEIERITEPNPARLIPLLQAAADEAEPELQTMWAALMANVMLDGGSKVRHDYVQVLRTLCPQDALLLSEMNDLYRARSRMTRTTPITKLLRELARDKFLDEWVSIPRSRTRSFTPEERISFETLVRRGCIEFKARGTQGPTVGNVAGLFEHEGPTFRMTSFGTGLLDACTVAGSTSGA